MKTKRKNSEKSNIKTPVRDFIRNFFMLSSGCITLLLVLPIVLFVFWQSAQAIFEWDNLPQVQQAVIEQCNLPDYQARGYFDSSSMNIYSDNTYSLSLHIGCIPTNFPNGNGSWQCNCRDVDA